MMARLLGWCVEAIAYVMLLVLLILAVVGLLGCASPPPPYLCQPGRLDDGRPAMLCRPYIQSGD